MKIMTVFLLLMTIVLSSGCGKKVEKPTLPPPPPSITKVFSDVDTLIEAGNTNGAIQSLQKAFTSGNYKEESAVIDPEEDITLPDWDTEGDVTSWKDCVAQLWQTAEARFPDRSPPRLSLCRTTF